jgi:hypothetical protein
VTPRPATRRALGALLLAPLASAAAEPSLLEAEGGTLVQMAAQPLVALVLRSAARGRQQMVYEGLRLPGPPVELVAGRWLVGWGCGAAGCTEDGLFMAFDTEREQLYLLLLEEGWPIHLAPPRMAEWPEALAEPFGRFAPGLSRGPRFSE